ncbi:MAG TPA: two-component regulator propeller domain-containing protein [Flavipsychrobacter sp.]|nr:two-component regulator propeller domain-containing protein [Flavipsychrobacter sp.]
MVFNTKAFMTDNRSNSILLLRLKLLVLLAFFFSTDIPAQRYPFHNVNIENGLIQSQSRDLAQDSMGHLWIATLGGLSRFDGKTFNNYTVRDGLLSNTIGAVEVDQQGMIWVGSMSGLSKFDGKTFKHFMLQSPEDPAGNSVSKIKIGHDGTAWCISGGKAFKVTGNRAFQIPIPNAETKISALLPEDNALWWARRGVLLRYANRKWDSISVHGNDPNNRPIITEIFRDSRKRLLFTTNAGLYFLDSASVVPVKIKGQPLDNIPGILSITEDKDRAIWLGLTSGVLRLTDTSFYLFKKQNGLSDNGFPALLTDMEGNVWMASDGQGIFRFSGAQFTVLDETSGLPSGQVMSIEADRYGRLYLGTYDAGLYVYENGAVFGLPLPIKGKPAIYALRFRKGSLWLGTAGAGLWKYDGVMFHQFTTQNSNIPSNAITSLYVDEKERLWIGGISGASYMERDSFFQIPLTATAVQDFVSIGNDSILLATENGMKLFYNNNVYSFTTNKAPDSASLQCFTLVGKALWIGSSNNGLIYYNLESGRSFVINKSNGLHSDFVYNLIADNEGNIWAGTGYGIHKITMLGDEKPLIRFYGKGQGVTGMESNHSAALKMPDGSIWFGTTNGAIHYRPNAKAVLARPTSIVLQSIKVFGENINDTSYYDSLDVWYKVPIGLRLPFKKNTITFTFHAVSLSSEEQIKYRYRIEGIDAPWSDWSNTNTVTFSALPPGKFTLQVQCNTDGSGVAVEDLSYPFEIIAPFHKTGWFRLIILMACILLGISIQYVVNKRKQYRLKLVEQLRREEQAKVRQRTAEDFHDEVGNRLTRINVLTNVLKNKIGTLTPDSERIIHQIQDNTAQLYSGTRDILWSLKPSNDSLYEILHRIRDFGGELFQDTEIDFQFEGSDEKWRNYKLPLDVGRNLIMIFKEALNNCLKYSKATNVKLEASLRDNRTLQMILTDDGGGFDIHYVKKGHGIGNMNVRAGRIKGRLYIDSMKGKGTIITLTFRLPGDYVTKKQLG